MGRRAINACRRLCHRRHPEQQTGMDGTTHHSDGERGACRHQEPAMRRLWCLVCYGAVRRWPFSIYRPWSWAAYLWLMPWAGEEAEKRLADENTASKP